MRILYLSIAFVMLSGLIVLVYGEAPHIIPYQARLTDASGNPITNPKYITYKIYTTPADPLGPSPESPLWSETHRVVPNSEGIYNVMLGSLTPFGGDVDFSEPYWLAIVIDGFELCRYQLGSSPYALNLSSLGALDGQVLKWNSSLAKWEAQQDLIGLSVGLQDAYRNGEAITITPSDPGYMKIETQHHDGGLMVQGKGGIEYSLYSELDLQGEDPDYSGSGAVHTKIIDNEASPTKWSYGELCKTVKNPYFEYYSGVTGVYMSSNNDTLAGALGVWYKRGDIADTFAAVLGYVAGVHREEPGYYAGLFKGDVAVSGDLLLESGIDIGGSTGNEGQVLTATGAGDVTWQEPSTGPTFRIRSNTDAWLSDSVRLVEGKNIKLTQFADSICIAFDESDGCPKVCADTISARISNTIEITDSVVLDKAVSMKGDFLNQEIAHCEKYDKVPDGNYISLDWAGFTPIPDNGCDCGDTAFAIIEVADFHVLITEVEVEIWVEHTYNNHLKIQLESPNGTRIFLTEWDGYDYNGFGRPEVYTRFDDDATQNISSAEYPYEGTYVPREDLSDFDGESPNGTWKLRICDDYPGEVGYIRGFRLFLNDSVVCCNWEYLGEASVTYRSGSSIVILSTYTADPAAMSGCKAKLTRSNVSGPLNEGEVLGYAADSPSGAGNQWISATIIHRDDGTEISDATKYYYKLWRMGRIEEDQENWSIVPMMIKE